MQTKREATRDRAMRFLARPTIELESAPDANGQTVRVGDAIEFAPGRTTVVTRIYRDPSSTKAYEAPAAEVKNAMVALVQLNLVRRAE